MKRRVLFCFLLYFFFISLLSSEKITLFADRLEGRVQKKEKVSELKGNAKIKTKDIEISADYIKLSGKDFRFLTARGNVRGKNGEKKLDFSCGELEYDRKNRIALLKGNAFIDDKANEMTAKAVNIDYDMEKETAILSVSVEIHKKENVCSGEFALYKKNDDFLKLSGNARVVQKNNDFRAQDIVFNLKTEEVFMSGYVNASAVGEGN